MDILAHGLWTGAAARAANSKTRKPLNVRWAIFWGVFPDLFAFTIPFIGLIWSMSFRGVTIADIPGPSNIEPPPQDTLWIFKLASFLYPWSHSLVIFSGVFLLVWLFARRPIWELGGWLLHILIDIPTHSYRFFPTPFLWPLSGWEFNGLSWGTPWFLVLNYAAIIIAYLVLKRKKL